MRRDVGLKSVQQPKWGDVGQVQKEGPGRFDLLVGFGNLLYEADGVGGEGISHEKIIVGQLPALLVQVERILLHFVEIADLGLPEGPKKRSNPRCAGRSRSCHLPTRSVR